MIVFEARLNKFIKREKSSFGYKTIKCENEINGNIIYKVEIQGAASNELLFVNPEMGTIDYLDINPGPNSSYPDDFVLVDDKYYFTANDGEHGYEMWVTDGTIEGTFMFEDITKGENSTTFYNHIYFEDNPTTTTYKHNITYEVLGLTL